MKKKINRYAGRMYRICPLMPFACPGCGACGMFSGPEAEPEEREDRNHGG